MQWDDLQVVLALARQGTLSGAAKALGATHTTVGRRLKRLQGELGAKLFEQTPAGFVLTPAGEDALAVAERAEAELLALEARVSGGDARLSGKLRVTTMDLLFNRHQAAFASFVARYPGIELTLHFSDDEASLFRRQADVALRMSNTPPEGLVGRRLGRVDFAVYGSRALIAARGATADLAAYPWIGWDEQTMQCWLDRWLQSEVPGAEVNVRINGPSTQLREVMAAGLGVHFLACSEGDADPRLERIGGVYEALGRDVWLLTLPDLKHQARVRALMDHLHEQTKAAAS